MEAGDDAALPVAISLLHRVVDDYDDFMQVPWARELLGEAYRRMDELERAERHFRKCLATAWQKSHRRPAGDAFDGDTRTIGIARVDLLPKGRRQARWPIRAEPRFRAGAQ